MATLVPVTSDCGGPCAVTAGEGVKAETGVGPAKAVAAGALVGGVARVGRSAGIAAVGAEEMAGALAGVAAVVALRGEAALTPLGGTVLALKAAPSSGFGCFGNGAAWLFWVPSCPTANGVGLLAMATFVPVTSDC